MELRKNPKIDLDKKRSAFFNIGLAISLLLVTSAFEWRFYSSGALVELGAIQDDFEKMIEIPPTVVLPPPPPVIKQPIVVEVPDEEIVEEVQAIVDAEITEDDIFEDPIFEEPLPVEKVEEVFDIVEVQPNPMGGMSSFYKFVGKHMKYPTQARRMRIEGKVFVQFVVDKSGNLTEVNAIKGIGGGCDEEAVRVIKNAPQWRPGKQRGRPVKVRMIIPITFKLS